MVMKRVLLVSAAATMAVLIGAQAAQANTISIAKVSGKDPYVFGSNVGTVDILNLVKDISKGPITLTQIEVWFGGEDITEAVETLTPPLGYSYDLDATASGVVCSPDTGFCSTSSEGGAVAPKKGGNPGDEIASAELVNEIGALNPLNNGIPVCYIGESLAAGASCDVELVLNITGVAPIGNISPLDDSSSVTNIFTVVAANNGTGVAQDYDVEIYVPEPRSLVLMGTGFGLLGLGVFLRRRYAAAHPKAD
jgi:hypothetical protein